MASKLGGAPYTTADDPPWANLAFLGQINFAEIDEPPDGAPRSGILTVASDRSAPVGSFVVRWHADPSEHARMDPGPVESMGRYEAALAFHHAWSLPEGKAWDAPLPVGDDELWRAWNDWAPPGFEVPEGVHRMFGHRPAGLDEHHGFVAPEGRSDDIRDYEMILEIDFDAAADLSWGTNTLYVVAHRDDLAEGRLDRAVVTGAGYLLSWISSDLTLPLPV
jgi:hypothetical protein